MKKDGLQVLKAVLDEIMTELGEYTVDFNSPEYIFLERRLRMRVAQYWIQLPSGLKEEEFNSAVNGFIIKLMEPYREIFNILKIKAPKNYLRPNDYQFQKYLEIIDFVIEGKSITKAIKELKLDHDNYKKSFAGFRKTHRRQIINHLIDNSPTEKDFDRVYSVLFDKLRHN